MGAAHRSARADAVRRMHRSNRRKSLVQPTYELSRTLTYEVGTIPFLPLSMRSGEVAFRFRLQLYPQPGSGIVPLARGLLFAIGGEQVGVAAWISNDLRLGFGAGSKPAILPVSNQTWTHHETTMNWIPTKRRNVIDLAFAVRPGDGTIRAWWNGEPVLAARSNAGTFARSGTPLWSGAFDGGFMTVPAAIPRVALNTAAPNASLQAASPLSVYVHRRPWHHNTGPQDPPTGPIPSP